MWTLVTAAAVVLSGFSECYPPPQPPDVVVPVVGVLPGEVPVDVSPRPKPPRSIPPREVRE